MRSRLWLAIVCHVALATAYAIATPSFEGPDENSHFEYAQHIANARQLPLAPAVAAARGLPQTEGAVLAHHPPLYYLLLAAGLVAAGADDTVFGPRLNPDFGSPDHPARHLRFLHGGGEDGVLLALRLVSMLLGAATVAAVHRLGRVCCPGAPAVADLAALLVACLPMWSFLHGVLNNDVLAALLATTALLALARALDADSVGWRGGLATGALIGLALLAKLTTLFLAALAAAAAARLWQNHGRRALPAVAAGAAAALLIVAPWLWRSAVLYGDPLALSAHDAAFPPIPAELRWYYFFGLPPWPAAVPSFLPTVLSSLLGRFGWFSLPPERWVVWLGLATAAAAALGLGRAALAPGRSGLPRHLGLLVAACLLVFAGAAVFNLTAPQPQGRLLFPAIAPAAVLVAAGLVQATRRLPGRGLLAAIPPLAAIAVFAGSFLPAFAPDLAPAPADHRPLVSGIVRPAQMPTITWLEPPAAQELAAAPLLRWSDPGAPPDTRYTLYASDTSGRVWLATHEWSHGTLVLTGGEGKLPAAEWAMLPVGTELVLRLRRVPATADEDPRTLPVSGPLPLRRR